MSEKVRLAITSLVLTAVYYLAAKLGLSLAFEQANTSPVWPPTGIAIAALIFYGYRVLPGVFLGAFLVNLATDLPVALSLCVAIGNSIEAAVALFLINKFISQYPLETVEGVARFIGVVFIATMFSATIGVMTLVVGGIAEWQTFYLLWMTWWLGDVVGGLVFTPFLITWARREDLNWVKLVMPSSLAIVALTIASIALVFSDVFAIGRSHYPLAFVFLPIAIWVAYRFGQHGASLFLIIISAFAISGTLLGYGPFVRESANESLLLLQGFMGVMMITTMSLAASIEERRRARRLLHESKEQLESLILSQGSDIATIADKLMFAELAFKENVDGILITDVEGEVLRVNPAFCEITGYSVEEIVGHDYRILKSDKHDKGFYKVIWNELLYHDRWQGKIWNRKKNGDLFLNDQLIVSAKDEDGRMKIFISFFRDVSDEELS